MSRSMTHGSMGLAEASLVCEPRMHGSIASSPCIPRRAFLGDPPLDCLLGDPALDGLLTDPGLDGLLGLHGPGFARHYPEKARSGR